MRYVQTLELVLNAIHRFANNRMKYPTDFPHHQIKPGEEGALKNLERSTPRKPTTTPVGGALSGFASN